MLMITGRHDGLVAQMDGTIVMYVELHRAVALSGRLYKRGMCMDA